TPGSGAVTGHDSSPACLAAQGALNDAGQQCLSGWEPIDLSCSLYETTGCTSFDRYFECLANSAFCAGGTTFVSADCYLAPCEVTAVELSCVLAEYAYNAEGQECFAPDWEPLDFNCAAYRDVSCDS